ncbi:cell wall metabolism sensor histidine kinase WalK [Dorea acetigenes]|uniref:histidine kinase n=1 Tax=Dorea acetigenes TaxID=2981787 RepID=A0ABT2RIH2_9FIRM|nr:ATP-binding protein [Dorea acetigenes]MCB6414412.1 cell wall metabolism sensor histidine kinase WalK [Faecalimonas umbilicata]MCU6685199.1 cell wall metabolism sensor histidine kinase WalK [Dorea acetigenes]SCI40025.1 Signal-transduction histidine kinase senX3 [uncultured Clostridium sp.]
MCTRSGELVIILEVKKFVKFRFLKSLRLRIVLILMLVGILPCIVMKAIVLESYEKRAVDVRTAEIQNQCTILCNSLGNSNYLADGTSEILQAELIQLSNIYSGRVMVIDNEFRVVEDTYNLDRGKTIVSGNVIKSFAGKGTSQYDDKNSYIEVTMPVTAEGSDAVLGVILVSVSTDTIVATMDVLEGKANIVEVILVFVIIILAVLVGTKMLRPFDRITKSIEDVTEGYDDNYLHEDTYTETHLISEAFNKMLGRQKVLNDSRQEFVANVSHELKTPLTSMKVLADSLLAQQDAPVELYQEFMADMSEEIEREDKIINDLLSLVKMDKAAAEINIKSENINELVERILKRLRPIAAVRNIELVYESFRPVTAEVDEVKLTLAVSNLVENAIKYNNENGWVHVSLNADHKFFYIEVADSGMGIPEEAQEHIFERFYRVDKSHSREIGGTGLGLAIARNAVVMHRGSIKVYSQMGEGTTFTVRIPISYAA